MIEIDLSDVESVVRAIGDEPQRALKAARSACVEVGDRVLRGAKAAAPRDRPWLSQSGIAKRTWSDRGGVHTDVFTLADPRGRPVGFFVEYGTSEMPPQPFLGPQMVGAADDLAAAVMRGLESLG